MSKILNIRLEEGATFSKLLTFTQTTTTGTSTHPITGVVTNLQSRTALPLTGYTFLAQIKDRFDNPTFTENMQVRVLDATTGRISISVSKEQTRRLVTLAGVQPTGVTNANRTYRIGYFDLLAVNSSGAATKVFYGEVYMTRSATIDPRVAVSDSNAIYLSNILPIDQTITLAVDRNAGQNYVGVRFYTGGLQVAATDGTVAVFRKPTTSNEFQSVAAATLQANQPVDEALINGNASEFQAVPNSILGADSYQLVVSSNRS